MGNGASSPPPRAHRDVVDSPSAAILKGIASVVGEQLGVKEKKFVRKYSGSWGRKGGRQHNSRKNKKSPKASDSTRGSVATRGGGAAAGGASGVVALAEARALAAQQSEDGGTKSGGAQHTPLKRRPSNHRRSHSGEDAPNVKVISWEASAANLAAKATNKQGNTQRISGGNGLSPVRRSNTATLQDFKAAAAGNTGTGRASSSSSSASSSSPTRSKPKPSPGPSSRAVLVKRSSSESLLRIQKADLKLEAVDSDASGSDASAGSDSEEEETETDSEDGDDDDDGSKAFNQFFKGIDTDGSGGLDMEEFVEYVCLLHGTTFQYMHPPCLSLLSIALAQTTTHEQLNTHARRRCSVLLAGV